MNKKLRCVWGVSLALIEGSACFALAQDPGNDNATQIIWQLDHTYKKYFLVSMPSAKQTVPPAGWSGRNVEDVLAQLTHYEPTLLGTTYVALDRSSRDLVRKAKSGPHCFHGPRTGEPLFILFGPKYYSFRPVYHESPRPALIVTEAPADLVDTREMLNLFFSVEGFTRGGFKDVILGTHDCVMENGDFGT